jgi:hypothetical protein
MSQHDQDSEVAEPAAETADNGAATHARSVMYGRYQPDEADAAAADATGDGFDDDAVLGDDVVVADVTDPDLDEVAAEEEHSGQPMAMPLAAPTVTEAETAEAGADAETGTVAGDTVAASTGPAAYGSAGAGGQPFSSQHLSQEWREIQASFVDDPRGAVQLAAEAADAALTALVTSLRDRHATLGPTAAQDTEQLRAALQEYRMFCQGIAETGRRFSVG